jgi:hypothetical protein
LRKLLTTSDSLVSFFQGGKVKGRGFVAWSFLDNGGMLRTLKLPAYWIPQANARLLSVPSLLQQYPAEIILADKEGIYLNGSKERVHADGFLTNDGIEVLVDPASNLPTAYAYQLGASEGIYRTPSSSSPSDGPSGPSPSSSGGYAAHPHGAPTGNPSQAPTEGAPRRRAGPTNPPPSQSSAVSPSNYNLSDTEKELLRWHFRLGHLHMRRVKFLMRSGALASSESLRRLHRSCVNLNIDPKCTACCYGKQRLRTAPGTKKTVVQDKVDALRKDNLFPGQRISVDHFVCSTKGRLFNSRGKTSDGDLYTGGCLFIDHATGFVHTELQRHLNTDETLGAKEAFELMCRDVGVIPQEYLSDNGSAFTSQGFARSN